MDEQRNYLLGYDSDLCREPAGWSARFKAYGSYRVGNTQGQPLYRDADIPALQAFVRVGPI